MEIEPRATYDRVNRFDTAVDKMNGLALNGADPGLRNDAAFGHKWQKVLAQGYPRFKDVVRRLKCAELLRAAVKL